MRLRLVVLFAIALIVPSLPLAAQRDLDVPANRPGRFGIYGNLLDAETNTPMENVMIELKSFTGPTVANVMTNAYGRFIINDLAGGTYNLIIERDGYQPIYQQVNLSSTTALQLELRRILPLGSVPGGATVSVRELSIPKKARDAMQKGYNLLYQKSDYKGSLNEFLRAIKEYPDYHEAYTQMAVAHMRMGDVPRSEEALRKSIALSKDTSDEAFLLLATLLTDAQRFAEAEPMAQKAVELKGNAWQSYFELARAQYGLNNLAAAEASALAAADLRPDNPDIYLMLANLNGRSRDYPALLENLNKYLELAPSGPQAEQAREARDKVQAALENQGAEPAAGP
jgi:tetratricopeptide (TPR) repeat protein